MNEQALLDDVLAARHDVLSLAKEHSLTPAELAAWVMRPESQRTLRGLCGLADLQTQLQLCRYRLSAAARLLQIATPQDEDPKSQEPSRRACVELLKLDLRGEALRDVDAQAGASLLEALNTEDEACPDPDAT